MPNFSRAVRRTRRILGRVFVRSTLYIAIVLLALSVLNGFVSYLNSTKKFEAQLVEDASHHAQVLINLSRGHIVDFDWSEIRRLARGMTFDTQVVGVDVFDASGESFLRDKLRPITSPEILQSVYENGQSSKIEDAETLTWYEPVIVSSEVSGVVAIVVTKQGLAEARAEIIQQSIQTTLLIFLFFLPVAAFLLYRTTKGISTVTVAANEAAQGFLDPHFKTDSGGEVGELQTAFRMMAQNLQRTIMRIEHLANVDHITYLPNRLKFGNVANKKIDQVPGAKGAMLLVDLDRFKSINDMYGHEVGDRLLLMVSERLGLLFERAVKDGLDTKPFLSRWSGDEFVVLLPNITDTDIVNALVEEILRELRRPLRVDNLNLKVRGSVGVAMYPEHGEASDEVLRSADMAMFAAKQSGRDRMVVYNQAIRNAAEERETIEKHLREALNHNELQVYYQPKVDLKSGRIIGAEALLRWHNPELGNVSPFRFIPMAEECGLMSSIGEFVLQQSLTDMQRLSLEGFRQKIAINVSPVQFQADFFTDRTLGLLGESGFPMDQIELEITESALGASAESVRQQMMPLKEEGVSFAIDDFGTGFSNLGTLTSLPFDTLKIDRSFVMNIGEDENRRGMIQVILLLARQLKMRTVAEGIETDLEHDFMRELGANIGQGYLWSPPVPYDKFREMVIKADATANLAATSKGLDIQRTGTSSA